MPDNDGSVPCVLLAREAGELPLYVLKLQGCFLLVISYLACCLRFRSLRWLWRRHLLPLRHGPWRRMRRPQHGPQRPLRPPRRPYFILASTLSNLA